MTAIKALLRALNINRQVKDTSLIGHRVLEIYVAEPQYEEVLITLNSYRVSLLDTFNPAVGQGHGRPVAHVKQAIINRLTHLYKRNHLIKMREAILQDFPEEIKAAVIENAGLDSATPFPRRMDTSTEAQASLRGSEGN